LIWWLTLLFPSYIFPFSLCIFFCNKQPPSNLDTIQPLITNLVTTTLTLSASVFWFKFYWGFSTLSKQVYLFLFELNFKMFIFFCIFFVVYVFCLGVYLFYSFFSYKFIVWIYYLYMLGFVFNFLKLYLLVNWWNLYWIFDLDVLW